ncbi:MAG: class II aldolase/adducin family protein [Atopobiaceae bacterium]|jgi:L-fuculose-phosphate aldolase|nr:class II aldolase/adducin family protein [Atopobiaceae bacterium]
MLESLKDQVLAIARQAQRDGMCKHKSGNFSMRERDSNLIVVTPSGVDRENLKSADMIVMDMDAHVIERSGQLRPSSEVLMHLAIYKSRPDVAAIVHTHSMYATVCAVLNRPIPAIVYEMQYLRSSSGKIPVAPYARPGSSELAANVAASLSHSDACLLQAHGAVAVDETNIENAYLKSCYIEEIAELYCHALSIGKTEPAALPPEELRSWSYPSEICF